jgi:CRP-like cAMP-binding protein
MQQIKEAIKQVINFSEDEINGFLSQATIKTVKRNEIVNRQNFIQNEIYFINKGLIRDVVTDPKGTEHTIHFVMSNQFITDYSSYLQHQPSTHILQALEETELVVLQRSTIEWAYKNTKEGEKMGRRIAEFNFILQDEHIKNMYVNTPKQRYDNITMIFPDIHNRVSQHMIASYLGITPVHLSRLKKAAH